MKLKTHIKNLDLILNEGLVFGNSYLISGKPGSGKTILTLEIVNNHLNEKNKQNRVIYFTFEEKKDQLLIQTKQFNFNFENFLKQNNLKIISFEDEIISKYEIEQIIEIIENFKPSLIIFDTITTFSYLQQENNIDEYKIKKTLYYTFNKLKKIKKITKIFISQKDEKIIDLTSRYLVDGIINLNYDDNTNQTRTISIPKHRNSKTFDKKYNFKIIKNGIDIKL